jgi:serine/threonine protein phosphatase PrpC
MVDSAPRSSAERAHYLRSPAPWVAGASDVGLRHETNEDALGLAVRSEPSHAAVLAVSDGVTTAHGSEVASLVATETVVDELVTRHSKGQVAEQAFVHAFAAAQRSVVDASDQTSACTLVAAVIDGRSVSVGNVGDSRAYWIPDAGGVESLTTDDSLAQARIMLGMTRMEAEQSHHSHALTRWLGRESSDATPAVTTLTVDAPGWLLLCTDGLWNYASDPADLADLVRQQASRAQSTDALADALVGWAVAKGGKDNVTVALARIEG